MVARWPKCSGVLALAVVAVGCGHTAKVEKNEKLARISVQLGERFLVKNKLLQAKQEFSKAIKLDPEYLDAFKMLGFVKLMEGLGSLYYIDRIQCLKGDEAQEHREVAQKHFKIAEENLKKAVKMAKKVNKIESESLLWLANIADHFKRYDDAVSYAEQGLKHSFYPKRHLLHCAKGWAHYKKREYRKAGEDLRQAVFHENKFCLGRYRLAEVYFAKKKYSRAIKELEWTAKQKCPIQEARYLLGRAYAQKRSMDQAREQFEKCVKMNPKSCLSKVCERLSRDASGTKVQVAE